MLSLHAQSGRQQLIVFGANPAALRTGNPLTFGDGRRLIAVTASGQITVDIDM
jgi:hypothetical protein